MKSIKANLVTPVPTKDLPPAPAKSPALTPWFPPSVKPVRQGVYISSVSKNERFYRYWDGENWRYGGYSIAQASPDKPVWNMAEWLHWRGLASNPASKP